jgi:hypothetical protein
MKIQSLSRVVLSAAFIGGMTTLPATTAFAQEGARSVGQGLKCYTAAVVQSNGTVKYQQVCYKSI